MYIYIYIFCSNRGFLFHYTSFGLYNNSHSRILFSFAILFIFSLEFISSVAELTTYSYSPNSSIIFDEFSLTLSNKLEGRQLGEPRSFLSRSLALLLNSIPLLFLSRFMISNEPEFFSILKKLTNEVDLLFLFPSIHPFYVFCKSRLRFTSFFPFTFF